MVTACMSTTLSSSSRINKSWCQWRQSRWGPGSRTPPTFFPALGVELDKHYFAIILASTELIQQ